MKTKYLVTLGIAGILCLTGCVGDLDVQPLDKNVITADGAYSDPASYEKALMKIYSVWAIHSQEGKNGTCDISGIDGGNSQILRSWFNLQTLSTDEAKCVWPNTWCEAINGLKWADEKNEAEEGVYQFGMYIVSLVNEFMKNVENAPEEVRAQYAAEARFNRALAYYILMDAFGYPPFITESNYSNAPTQIERAQLFEFIESELNTIRPDLPQARQGTYGRADQGAVDALLARMYLNAETYTGTPRYDDCIETCKRIFNAGYALASNYADLFKADNGQNPDTQKEIIFPICFDGTKTQTWGGCSYIILASRAVEFDDPAHRTIAMYVMSGRKTGQVRASGIFDLMPADGELAEILNLDYGDNLDSPAAEKYFSDCVRTLRARSLSEKIDAERKRYFDADEEEKRKILAKIMEYTTQLKSLSGGKE